MGPERGLHSIKATGREALASCAAEYSNDLASLSKTIEPETGAIVDREGLIDELEGLGAPEGALDAQTDDNLSRLAQSMPKTNLAICRRDAYANTAEALNNLE